MDKCRVDETLPLGRGTVEKRTCPPSLDADSLRKRCKELRYLLEFFAGLYDKATYKAFVDELKRLQRAFADDVKQGRFIIQPFVAGIAASVALVFAPSQREVEVLVPAEQARPKSSPAVDERLQPFDDRLPVKYQPRDHDRAQARRSA